MYLRLIFSASHLSHCMLQLQEALQEAKGPLVLHQSLGLFVSKLLSAFATIDCRHLRGQAVQQAF